jgi:6-phosphogluconolactonase (cycloisomerase 2 family)
MRLNEQVRAGLRTIGSARCLGLAVGTAFAVAAAVALAATGAIVEKGCVADVLHNPDGCPKVTKGLLHAENGLDAANWLALTKDGSSLYAVGNGQNAVVHFQRDTSTGRLTAKGCVADPNHNSSLCPATAKGLDGATSVAISSDDKSLYVAGADDSAIASFGRSSATGNLTAKGCVADNVTNPDGCPQTGIHLTSPLALAMSSDGTSLYATLPSENAIAHLQRDTTTGKLTWENCMTDVDNPAVSGPGEPACSETGQGLDSPEGLVVSSNDKWVYATGTLDNAVARFRRNKTTGNLTFKDCVADPANNNDGCTKTAKGLDRAQSLALSSNGKSLYVAGESDHAVVTFQRDTTSGVLTPKGCVGYTGNNPDHCSQTASGLFKPVSVAASADGKSVYAGSTSGIARFDRDPTTGALTPQPCIGDVDNNLLDGCPTTAKAIDGPWGVVGSHNSKWVYVAGTADNAIARFARQP